MYISFSNGIPCRFDQFVKGQIQTIMYIQRRIYQFTYTFIQSFPLMDFHIDMQSFNISRISI